MGVTADPNILTVPGDNNGLSPTGEAYAVFTLNISNDSKGFYILELPPCLQLLASGYSASQVNASDFGGWVQQVQLAICSGNAQVNVVFVSESNLNITYPVISNWISARLTELLEQEGDTALVLLPMRATPF